VVQQLHFTRSRQYTTPPAAAIAASRASSTDASVRTFGKAAVRPGHVNFNDDFDAVGLVDCMYCGRRRVM
jgi:hypothetical protein